MSKKQEELTRLCNFAIGLQSIVTDTIKEMQSVVDNYEDALAKEQERTKQLELKKLKGVSKRKRAKDGVHTTQRYSFEITAELKQQLERAVLEHQLATGKKVSTSKVIRTAIEKYLKTG